MKPNWLQGPSLILKVILTANNKFETITFNYWSINKFELD